MVGGGAPLRAAPPARVERHAAPTPWWLSLAGADKACQQLEHNRMACALIRGRHQVVGADWHVLHASLEGLRWWPLIMAFCAKCRSIK